MIQKILNTETKNCTTYDYNKPSAKIKKSAS